MHCEQAAALLSAYIDHEVDAGTSREIDEHVERCEHCQIVLADYLAMGALARQSEAPVNTDVIWSHISESISIARRHTWPRVAPKKRRAMQWSVSVLAAAASLAFVFYALAPSRSEHQHTGDQSHSHASLATDFEEVFQFANREPQRALSTLASKYEGRQLNEQETTSYLGYEPALYKGVPKGFTLVSTYVLKMPCCKCSATICERQDGSSLIIFEHREEQPVWFGGLPSIETSCAGKTCKITESDGQLAASWKTEDRQLTVIAANNIEEVTQWVASLSL